MERQHNTKRPSKGRKRAVDELELDKELTNNRKRNHVKDLELGRFSSSNLYSQPTLRKSKQESKDKSTSIKYKCPVQSLIEFKHNSSLSGSIHAIGIDPFFIHYWTVHQLGIYKDACKKYTKLSIDSTGSLVKKLKRTSLDLFSDNVFFYEGVLSSSFGHISVTQMLSEKQDTLTIYNWLASWMATDIQPPNEVVCEYSHAILGAATRTFFKGSSTDGYVNYVFKLLIGKENEIPSTYIRLNVSHIIQIFCRIKCLVGTKNRQLMDFYTGCFRLLLTSEDLSTFEIMLEALLTIMLSETDGWSDSDNIMTPSEKQREYVLNLIKSMPVDNENINDSTMDFLESEDVNIDFNDNMNENSNSGPLVSFLENIRQKSLKNSSIKGNRVSAYYLPELLPDMMRLCKHFPLWTNILCNVFKSPYKNGSSAAVENDFKELKTQMLRFEVKPMSADRFIKKHLTDINNNTKLFKSKQLKYSSPPKAKLNYNYYKETSVDNISESKVELNYNHSEKNKKIKKIIHFDIKNQTSTVKKNLKTMHNNDDLQSSSKSNALPSGDDSNFKRSRFNRIDKNFNALNSSDDSINAVENRKRKNVEDNKSKEKKKNSKYTDSTKEIDRTSRTTRSSLNTLLVNGNKKTPIYLLKKSFSVQNTCPFDAVSVLISTAYLDIKSYTQFIDIVQNDFLFFCKKLAINGPTLSIYKNRVLLLRNIFRTDSGNSDTNLIDARCNVTFIISSYLKNSPSAIETVICLNSCPNSKVLHSPFILLKLTDKLHNLEADLNKYTKEIKIKCSNCNGTKTTSRKFREHIFIEIDYFSREHSYRLKEFPDYINVNKNRYVIIGTVGYENGHYISYIKRYWKWEIHNDLQTKITRTTSKKKIQPHLIMYVKV